MNLFKKKLPHCDILFQKFISPWYPENDRPTMPRPDICAINTAPGEQLNIETIQYLPGDLLRETKIQLEVMSDAALQDYQYIIAFGQLDLHVLDRVDKHFDRIKIAEIIKQSDPQDYSNEYLISVCEFGAMLGYLFNQEKGFAWLCSDPYFDSVIIHLKSGYAIPVFDWAVKKFSEYGVDDGFVAKYQMALETIKESSVNNCI